MGSCNIGRKLGITLFCEVLFLTSSFPITSQAQVDALGGLTLGAFLNKSLDQVDQSIDDARNAGNGVAIEVGRQAAIAIQEAQNAYQDSLNKTAAQLNQTVLTSVDRISSLTNDVLTKTNMTVQQAEAGAQQVTNSLPFSKSEPQVTSVSPNFVVPKNSAASNNDEIIINGNFPNSSRQGYQPYLKIAGTTYSGSNTTQKLTFLVPEGILFSQTASDPGKIQFASATLMLPWVADRFFGLTHVRREDNFNLLIGSLPASPGSITVLHTVQGSNPVVQTFCTPNLHQASTREAGNNDDKNHVWTASPDGGWQVVRNTSHIQMHSSQGDYSGPDFMSDDGNEVLYTATTIHHGFGSSGSIDFSICFQETQNQATQHVDTIPVTLQWGGSQAFPFADGSWQVDFVDFTGKTNQFLAPSNASPFITISDQGNGFVIQAADPDHLNWP